MAGYRLYDVKPWDRPSYVALGGSTGVRAISRPVRVRSVPDESGMGFLRNVGKFPFGYRYKMYPGGINPWTLYKSVLRRTRLNGRSEPECPGDYNFDQMEASIKQGLFGHMVIKDFGWSLTGYDEGRAFDYKFCKFGWRGSLTSEIKSLKLLRGSWGLGPSAISELWGEARLEGSVPNYAEAKALFASRRGSDPCVSLRPESEADLVILHFYEENWTNDFWAFVPLRELQNLRPRSILDRSWPYSYLHLPFDELKKASFVVRPIYLYRALLLLDFFMSNPKTLYPSDQPYNPYDLPIEAEKAFQDRVWLPLRTNGFLQR